MLCKTCLIDKPKEDYEPLVYTKAIAFRGSPECTTCVAQFPTREEKSKVRSEALNKNRVMLDEFWSSKTKVVEIKRMPGESDKDFRRRYKKEWHRVSPKSKEAVDRWQKKNRETLNTKRSTRNRRIESPSRPRPELCEACGQPETSKHAQTGTLFMLALDHCHKTMKFRGWICFRCNTIAGKAQDDPEILGKIARYLRNNQ